MIRGRAARFSLCAAAVVAGGIAALAAVWLLRVPIAARALRLALASAGLDAMLEVRRVDLRSADIGPIALGIGAPLRIETLRLEYAPRELLGGRLRSVGIEGLRGTVRIADGGSVAIDGVDLSRRSSGESGAALPVDVGAIEWEEVRLDVLRADTRLDLDTSGHLLLDGSAPRGRAELAIGGDDPLARARLDIRSLGADSGEGGFELELHDLDLDGIAAGLEASLRGELALERGQIAFRLSEDARVAADGLLAPGIAAHVPDPIELRIDGSSEDALSGHFDLADGSFAGAAAFRVQGGMRGAAPFEARVRLSRKRAGSAPGEIAADVELGPLRLNVPALGLEADVESGTLGWKAQGAGGSGGFTLRAAALAHAASGVKLRQVKLDGQLHAGGGAPELDARFSVGSGELRDARARLPPLALSGRLLLEDGQLTGSIDALDRSKALRAHAELRHRLATARGSAELRIGPLRFVPGGLQPASLSPHLKGVGEFDGSIAAWIDVDWGRELRSKGRLAISDLSIRSDDFRIEGIRGELNLPDLANPSTETWQILNFERFDAPTPLSDGMIAFRPRPGHRLELLVDTKLWRSGSVALRGVSDLARGSQRGDILLEDIDLGRLVALLDIDGLSADGRLAGHLPLTSVGDRTQLSGGRLEAGGGGVLRYRPSQLPAALSGGDRRLSLVAQALQEFHYERLIVKIEGDVEGEMKVVVELSGSSPRVEGGRPLELTVDFSGNPAGGARAALLGFRLPDQLIRSLMRVAD